MSRFEVLYDSLCSLRDEYFVSPVLNQMILFLNFILVVLVLMLLLVLL